MDRYLMNALCAVSLVALVAMGAGAALASSNKIVLMPGGPNPFWPHGSKRRRTLRGIWDRGV
jgi:hypothetical protein